MQELIIFLVYYPKFVSIYSVVDAINIKDLSYCHHPFLDLV